MKRRASERTIATAAVAALAVLGVLGRFLPAWEFRSCESGRPWRILDRYDRVIRSEAGDRGAYLPLTGLSPWIVRTTLAAEDRRFYHHRGLDGFAILRALAIDLRAGHLKVGGSTLTQQLARLLLGHRSRHLTNKLEEALLAAYLDWRLPKAKVLEYFFSRAPYGNECYGIYAASRRYFDRDPASLSLAQAAFLSVIPRNPNRYNPLRSKERVLRLQAVLLDRMRAQGLISAAEHSAARAEPVLLVRDDTLPPAGHFCDWVRNRAGSEGKDLRTTLDLELNSALERQVSDYVAKLGRYGISNAAVVVLRNEDRSVLAMIGSADYYDPNISGEVNGVVALRQPGSSIKPFTYGLALERGLPASHLLPDLATHFASSGGDFTPRNYDEEFHGPTRLRTALGCSYNIPAVRVLEQLNVNALLDRLRAAGFSHLRRPSEFYGLGLTLGNGEVTLLELTRAYAALADQGRYRPERTLRDEPSAPPTRLFPATVAFLLAHILSDASARAPAFGETSPLNLPFPCAVKTGTTKNYKDNWAVGFTREVTVGVWVGNFDGSPMHGVSGVSGAGPLFRDVMLTLHRDQRPEDLVRPEGISTLTICPLSGDLATSLCPDTMSELFLTPHEPSTACRFHQPGGRVVYPPLYRDWEQQRSGPTRVSVMDGEDFYIDFPDAGDVFRLDPGLRREYQCLRLRAVVPGGVEDLTWHLDGKVIGHGPDHLWSLVPGRHTLTLEGRVRDRGRSAPSVSFLVLP